MHLRVGSFLLRKPEPHDVPALYRFRNDAEITRFLGGFSVGYAERDLLEWVERHRNARDEVLWVVADAESDACIGHVGLYNIDHRVRAAEFAVLIGDSAHWGNGLGTALTRAALGYGFSQLNLHRIYLTVLDSNPRAIHLYEKLGFVKEGVMRDSQFRDGAYCDTVLMSLLDQEWSP